MDIELVDLNQRTVKPEGLGSSSEDEHELCEHDNFLPVASLHARPVGVGGGGGGGEITEKEGSYHPHHDQRTLSPKKEITLVSGVAVITGQIIGSGIYVTPKTILKYSGSFGVSFILWIFGAMVAVCGALCYIEVGLLAKKSGGDYVYILKAYSFNRRNRAVQLLGSMLGFMLVWTDFLLVRPSSMAVGTMICARYFIRPFFIGCDVPEGPVRILALSIIILICSINALSVKVATKIITLLSTVKVLSLVSIIAVGLIYTLYHRKIPDVFNQPFEARDGYVATASSLSLALYGVLWSYDGWNAINYTFEEIKNVRRNLPFSILIGIAIVATSYLLVNLSYFAVLSYEEILRADAIALPFGHAIFGTAGLVLIPLMVGVSVLGSSIGSIFSTSRSIFGASRDGLLPELFSGLHTTTKIPLPAIIVMGLGGSIYLWIGDISELIEGCSAAVFIFYLLVIVGLIIMRFTYRDEPRIFKAWFIIPVAIFMVFVFLFLIFLPLFLKPIPSLMAFSIILLGVPVYLFFVMETPWRLRPRVFDEISGFLNEKVSLVLNTKSTRTKGKEDKAHSLKII